MKTWKREKEKGRERNWKKERKVAGKEKEDLLLKRGSMVFSLIRGGRSVGIREGDSSFLMLLLCSVLQTLSGLSQYKNLSPYTCIYLALST